MPSALLTAYRSFSARQLSHPQSHSLACLCLPTCPPAAVKCDESGEALPGEEPLELWRCTPKPVDDPYSFTTFAHTLNSCADGINPLPSDSRRRPDRALLEAGNSSGGWLLGVGGWGGVMVPH